MRSMSINKKKEKEGRKEMRKKEKKKEREDKKMKIGKEELGGNRHRGNRKEN